MKKRSEMTKIERIKDTIAKGTVTSKILDKIHAANEGQPVEFDRPDQRSLAGRKQTLQAVIRREVADIGYQDEL